jgi:chromosome segregation ATPase
VLKDSKRELEEQQESVSDYQNQISELKSRIQKYEKGYGIEDAAKEVQEAKLQTRLREKEFEKHVLEMQKQEDALTKFYEENRALKEKLGMPPEETIDMSELKIKEKIEIEQLRAVNSQYEKEIASLEEERIAMKSQLRFQALQQGKQASALGLTHDQLLAIENYSDKLKNGGAIPLEDRSAMDLQKEINRLTKELGRTKKQIAVLELEREELMEESKYRNKKINRFAKEPLQADDSIIQTLLSELRKLNGNTLRNNTMDELRSSNLPEVLPQLSDIVSNQESVWIYQECIVLLNQLKEQESKYNSLQADLESYKFNFQELNAQYQLLFNDYVTSKQEFEKSQQQLTSQNTELSSKYQNLQEKQAIYDANLSAINSHSSKDEVQLKLADTTKELILVKVSHNNLQRKVLSLTEEEARTSKQRTKLENDMKDMEFILKQRILDLEFHHESLLSFVAQKQEQLEESVDKEQYEKIERNYATLLEKYQDTINHNENQIKYYSTKQQYYANIKDIQDELQATKDLLQEEQQKSKRLEQVIKLSFSSPNR